MGKMRKMRGLSSVFAVAVVLLCSGATDKKPSESVEASTDAQAEVTEARRLLQGERAGKNLLKARRLLESAAEKGNAIAHLMLADSYSTPGETQDMNAAYRHYAAAAQQGIARAMSMAAWMYGTGTGVPRDLALADKYIEAAAVQGDAYAVSAWAQRRRSQSQDSDEYLKLTMRAAELGAPLSQVVASSLL